MAQADPLSPFVCCLDATRAREVCEAHDYLIETRNDLVTSLERTGTYGSDLTRLAKIDKTLALVIDVFAGRADFAATFRHLSPTHFAVYATH